MNGINPQRGFSAKAAPSGIILVIMVGLVVSTGIRPAFVTIFGEQGLSGVRTTGGPSIYTGPALPGSTGPTSGIPTSVESAITIATTQPTGGTATTSAWMGKVRLSLGNGGSETDPAKEYITIQNNSPYDAVITGWQLANGRGDKFIKVNLNQEFMGTSDAAVIPTGTYNASTLGFNDVRPIILKAGERANVITGKSPSIYPASVNASFKETKCTGYLDQKNAYTPALQRNCPLPDTNSPTYRALSDSCYNFVRSIYRCQDPYVDNSSSVNQLSAQCRDFVRAEYNYQGCVTKHQADADYYGKTWTIFLGKSSELWSSTRENYYLYDGEGKLVDKILY